MKLTQRNGEVAKVTFEKEMATVNGRKVAGVRNNSVKLWNSDLFDMNGNNTIVNEMKRLFVKNVVDTGKKRK